MFVFIFWVLLCWFLASTMTAYLAYDNDLSKNGHIFRDFGIINFLMSILGVVVFFTTTPDYDIAPFYFGLVLVNIPLGAAQLFVAFKQYK
ncbi:hypothetical protein ACQW5G_04330 [Fructilactobacillus sp. Tb1]|uniref:hypothetical protein n=1 Tax=Fructilactobacillus sp. Tb1 TaxID=3422304 RepID=UPI003D2BBC59